MDTTHVPVRFFHFQRSALRAFCRAVGGIMAKEVDFEIEAIKTILHTLTPLSQEVRQSVIDYVLKRLNLGAGTMGFASRGTLIERIDASLEAERPRAEKATHIRDL